MADKEVDLDALAEAEESFRPSWAAVESSPEVPAVPDAAAAASPPPAPEPAPIVPTAVINVGGPTAAPVVLTNGTKPSGTTAPGVAPPAPGSSPAAVVTAAPVRDKIESADVIEAAPAPAAVAPAVASVPPPARKAPSVPPPKAPAPVPIEAVDPVAKGFTTSDYDDEIIIPKRGGGKGLVIGVAAVLLLGGIGAGVKFGLMGDDKPVAKPVTPATASQAAAPAPSPTMEIPPPPDKEELAAQEAAKEAAKPSTSDSAKAAEPAPAETAKPTSEGSKAAEPAPVHASVGQAPHPKVAAAPAPAPAPRPRAPAPAPAPTPSPKPNTGKAGGGIVRDSPF